MEAGSFSGRLVHFYIHENDRHGTMLLWQWLLEEANRLGIRGGTAFQAMAGFGQHHALHERHFFELAGTLAVKVEFIVSETEAEKLLEVVAKTQRAIFYTIAPARFGILNAKEPSASA
jgi:PII-like signaling protein